MKIIVTKLSEISRITGKQEFQAGISYRKTPYCIEQDVDGGKLAFNTLTGEMVFLTPDEAGLFAEIPSPLDYGKAMRYLVEHWYYLPAWMDAHTMGYLVRQGYGTEQKNRADRRVNSFTILTTTTCNARCPYCYERGIRQYSMDAATAEAVAEYIQRYAAGEITLRWFGGEPLCNMAAMDTITGRLRESGIPFRSSITTNGYLFYKIPDETIRGWNLRNAQITVDGTHDQYNRTKGYIETGGDPYEIVMGNISRLLDLGVSVVIRMNVSNENAADLLHLADEIAVRFRGQRGLAAYPYPVFEGIGDPPFLPSDEEREQLYDHCIRIFDKSVEHNLAPLSGIRLMKSHHCMADSGKSRVIFPDGKFALCQHYNEAEVCGTIFNRKTDLEKISEWSKRTAEADACRECVLYPVCFRLEKCPNEVKCSAGERRFQERKIHASMLREYERMKRQ